MALWSIEPVARPDDPRWQDHPRFARVVVRAPSAAMARLIAGDTEYHPDRGHVGNEGPANVVGLLDEKLYAVAAIQDPAREGFAADGPDEVLLAQRADDATPGAPAAAEPTPEA